MYFIGGNNKKNSPTKPELSKKDPVTVIPIFLESSIEIPNE
jgi:hypothetical protein